MVSKRENRLNAYTNVELYSLYSNLSSLGGSLQLENTREKCSSL